MHTHIQDIIKIDEDGTYFYWKCSCGAVGGEEIESSDQLAKLCKLAYEV